MIPQSSTAYIQQSAGIPQITFPAIGGLVRYVIDRIRVQLYSGTSAPVYASFVHAASAVDGTLWRKLVGFSTTSASEIALPEIDDSLQLIFGNGAGPVVTFETAIGASFAATMLVDFHLQG